MPAAAAGGWVVGVCVGAVGVRASSIANSKSKINMSVNLLWFQLPVINRLHPCMRQFAKNGANFLEEGFATCIAEQSEERVSGVDSTAWVVHKN
jgi:hypothetical protein